MDGINNFFRLFNEVKGEMCHALIRLSTLRDLPRRASSYRPTKTDMLSVLRCKASSIPADNFLRINLDRRCASVGSNSRTNTSGCRAITASADSLPSTKTADQADTITAPIFLDAALVSSDGGAGVHIRQSGEIAVPFRTVQRALRHTTGMIQRLRTHGVHSNEVPDRHHPAVARRCNGLTVGA